MTESPGHGGIAVHGVASARRPGAVGRGTRLVRTYPSAAAGVVLLAVYLGFALAAFFFHSSAYELNLGHRLQPPAWQAGGGWPHVLGTDTLGRDVLVRIMVAARISLEIAGAAVVLAGAFGLLVGMISGYFGGFVDDVIMRLTDSILAIPIALFALSVIAVLGPSLRNLIFVIAFSQWMLYARTARAETLSFREQQYITAARSLGSGDVRILSRHIAPHLLPSTLALGTLNVSTAVLLEAGLSYLGLGVQPPNPSLGSMLNDGLQYIQSAPWLALYPGLALFLLVLGINLLGDGIRAYVDPHGAAGGA